MKRRNTRKINTRKALAATSLALAALLLCFSGQTFAWLNQAAAAPVINIQGSYFEFDSGRLVIKGDNFDHQADVLVSNATGPLAHARVKVKGAKKIYIKNLSQADINGGVDLIITNPDGNTTGVVRLVLNGVDDRKLTQDDVRKIIAQAVAQAEASRLRATIAVTDKEGNILGVFRMDGAPGQTKVGIGTRCASNNRNFNCGLEGLSVPSCLAAISKAVTGAFLSSQGHAFSTRTASFIVQEHFPPNIDFQPSGPLFGVQFSQLLVCSDVNAKAPLGLSADPGGIPLYKNGLQVGGIGVEGDGRYTADRDPADDDMPVEELVAVAASRGFEAPPEITGDKIIVNGIRFPYVNTPMPAALPTRSFDNLRGEIDPCIVGPTGIIDTPASTFRVITLPGAPAGRVDNRFFPFRSGSALTAAEVQRVIIQAAKQAFITRAAIRQPLNSPAEVNITVVDTDGTILGIFSTIDAPIFGFDVSAQKARTAAFFSNRVAAGLLRNAGFADYVNAATRDDVALNGSVAFTDRAHGFLSRPFYPDGVNETEHGPFSVPIEDFSPFNVGLQLDLLLQGDGAVGRFLTTGMTSPGNCTGIPNLANGIQIFPGSVPLYKGGRLVGAIGISGDGVDQDDLIATMGSAGFEAPNEIRSDRVFVREVRLPYVKFPRHPNRD